MLTKSEFRRAQINKLHHYYAEITKAELQPYYQELFATTAFKSAQVIGVTISMADELNTRPIIERAWQLNKQVVVPITFGDHQMAFVNYEKDTVLAATSFGVLEPQGELEVAKDQIDLIVVPGVAFTKDGWRVGFGGGFYDRYLAAYQGQTIAIGTPGQLFSQPEWPVSKFDIRIQQVIYQPGEDEI